MHGLLHTFGPTMSPRAPPPCSLSLLLCIAHFVIATAMKVNFQVYSICGIYFIWNVFVQLYHSGAEAHEQLLLSELKDCLTERIIVNEKLEL